MLRHVTPTIHPRKPSEVYERCFLYFRKGPRVYSEIYDETTPTMRWLSSSGTLPRCFTSRHVVPIRWTATARETSRTTGLRVTVRMQTLTKTPTSKNELSDLCSDDTFNSKWCATCVQVFPVPAPTSPTEGGGQPLPTGCGRRC